jgi:hypothetical protein
MLDLRLLYSERILEKINTMLWMTSKPMLYTYLFLYHQELYQYIPGWICKILIIMPLPKSAIQNPQMDGNGRG